MVDDGDNRLLTVAVDGPHGSGKTTLVKNVFWKPQIRAQFDCYAWVSVSQDSQRPDIGKICQDMLRQLCNSRRETYHGEDGSTNLQEYLVGKKYLVVVDDISENQQWSNLKNALPDSNCGSRIILTTRYSNLSSIWSYGYRLRLHGLESLDAWTLFCRRAFPDGERPSDLKDISSQIMARCEGLPLAIVAVAGALAQKSPTTDEWELFHSNLGSGMGSLSAINNALLPNYLDLPSKLKCCFLYMSIFPEDYTVERGRLIRLWVAEGFATPEGHRTAEEVAEDYLNQLIHRNLLQVSSWGSDGRPNNCRVGNIVLNFIIQKCKDDCFASIFTKDYPDQAQNPSQRRVSVHGDCPQHLLEKGDFARVRSMLLFRFLERHTPDFEELVRKPKFMKILDVQGEPLTHFPEEITRFTLMRYLSFRDTKIKSIPTSIKKLSFLETLDLGQTDVVELPQEISYLHNLCHLFAYKCEDVSDPDCVRGVQLHQGIYNLEKLQSLSLVEAGPEGTILTDLKELTRLRKLGVTGLRTEHGKPLWEAVELMKSLKDLEITSATKEEYIKFEKMRDPPKALERLYLKGRLEELPAWIGELHNLVWICLKWSKLSDSPLTTLKRLQKLRELHLVDCYTGEDLTFEASGFKKLKNLVIKDFSDVNTIKIEHPRCEMGVGRGGMPELKKISLHGCPRIVTMVLGVAYVKVEELTLHNMAEELVARISIDGEDRVWVEHIPLIHCFTLKDEKWSLQNLSAPVSFSPR